MARGKGIGSAGARTGLRVMMAGEVSGGFCDCGDRHGDG